MNKKQVESELSYYFSKRSLDVRELQEALTFITAQEQYFYQAGMHEQINFDLCLSLEKKLAELFFNSGMEASKSLAFVQALAILEKIKQAPFSSKFLHYSD